MFPPLPGDPARFFAAVGPRRLVSFFFSSWPSPFSLYCAPGCVAVPLTRLLETVWARAYFVSDNPVPFSPFFPRLGTAFLLFPNSPPECSSQPPFLVEPLFFVDSSPPLTAASFPENACTLLPLSSAAFALPLSSRSEKCSYIVCFLQIGFGLLQLFPPTVNPSPPFFFPSFFG